MTEDRPKVTFSFVCPVYNEEEGLDAFYKRLTTVAIRLGEPYEIIFVNDGSTDGTAALIERLMAGDEHIRYVEFSRNFGHQIAVTAGYDYATGQAAISLDSDGQHPPELIPQLVAKWREGYEVVYTVRRDTAGISVIRKNVGRLVYRLIQAVSGIDLTDQADFRLLDRKALEALRQTREQARFVRGLVKWIGFKQVAVPYEAQRRTAGRSNYSLRQLLRMSSAGMYNFSLKPLRLAYVLGAGLVTIAIMYALVAIILWALDCGPSAIANLSMAIVGLFGTQFFLMGLLGEYVGRVFEEAKDRPLYIVRQVRGFEIPELEEAPPRPVKHSEVFQQKKFVLYT